MSKNVSHQTAVTTSTPHGPVAQVAPGATTHAEPQRPAPAVTAVPGGAERASTPAGERSEHLTPAERRALDRDRVRERTNHPPISATPTAHAPNAKPVTDQAEVPTRQAVSSEKLMYDNQIATITDRDELKRRFESEPRPEVREIIRRRMQELHDVPQKARG